MTDQSSRSAEIISPSNVIDSSLNKNQTKHADLPTKMINSDILNDYQREILTTLLHSNSLSIFAGGIEIESVLLALLKIYATEKCLVLLVNAKDKLLRMVQNFIGNENYHFITSEIPIKQRSIAYVSGGIVAITSRILVVDLLLDRIPSHLVNGIFVFDAEEIAEKSNEAFILHLYRTKNKQGFIRAFSSVPQSFLYSTFNHLERMVNVLHVDEVFLWPRFHVSIADVLDKVSFEVEEICLKLPREMREIQILLMQLLESILSELKRTLGIVEMDEFRIERALLKSFSNEVKQIICTKFPYLNSPGNKPMILLEDIKRIRSFINYLFSTDSDTFFASIELFRVGELAKGVPSSFIFQNDAWNLLHTLSSDYATRPKELTKLSPKLQAVVDLIKKHSNENILVIVKNEKNKKIIADILNDSVEREVLQTKSVIERFSKKLPKKPSSFGKESILKRLKVSTASNDAPSQNEATENDANEKSQLTISDFNNDTEFNLSPEDFECFEILTVPIVTISTIEQINSYRYISLLNPSIIVIFDPLLDAIRRIESNESNVKSVFFLMYKNSIEEQKFLSQIRNEKLAFEKLIHENSLLPQRISDSVSTTNQNDKNHEEILLNEFKPKIIVDMRDFRSPLSFVLYKMGFAIYPVTLEVGDYILSKNICIERKSISDLVSSLNSGRLYSQLQAMVSSYRRPMLLIEFDPTKNSFYLQGTVQQLSMIDIYSKLCLLTIHFPTVKLIWSPNLEFTAKVFQSLKQQQFCGEMESEPDIAIAQNESFDESFSSFYEDLLLKVDGIHDGNVFRIMSAFSSVCDLVEHLNDSPIDGVNAVEWEKIGTFFNSKLM